MTSTRRIVHLTLAGGLALAGLTAVPAVAKDKAGSTAPAEAGCYDSLETSTAVLKRTFETVTTTDPGTVDVAPLDGTPLQPVNELDDTSTSEQQATPVATLEVTLDLAAPSCTDARYRFSLADEAGTFLEERAFPGDGTSSRKTFTLRLDDYPRVDGEGRCLQVVGAITDVNGLVADRMPSIDAERQFNNVCESTSGGSQFWG